ncbi:MAG TPA: hypothetical protein VK008_08115 [Sphingobacteriaceae bacterium]|nr:hypothetical protein [Sphingobacteriaceae bacterium]
MFTATWTAAGPAAGAAAATAPPAKARVTLVLAAGWEWDGFQAQRHRGPLARHLDNAVVALLNTATGSRMAPEHGYATMAAGIRAVASSRGGQAFAAGETQADRPASAAYQERTGWVGREGLLHLGLGAIQRDNGSLGHRVVFGSLGDILQRAGLTAGVYGNADLPGEPARHAVMVAMDSRGQVPGGRIDGSILVPAPWLPGGKATNWNALLKAWEQEGAHFGVIETGDLWRLARARNTMTGQGFQQALARAEGQMAAGVADLLTRAARHAGPHLVLLVSPAPTGWEAGAQGFGWIAAWAFNADKPAKGGLLTSATTRRPGLVSLVDMGPTVLRFLGLEEEQPAHWTGRPMTATAAGPSRWEGLTAWSREVLANHHRRVPLLQGYVTVQIIVVLTAVGLLLWPAPRRLLAPWLAVCFWLAALVPLIYLLLPLLPGRSLVSALAWLFLILAVAGAGYYRRQVRGGTGQPLGYRHPVYLPFAAVAGLTVAVALADTALGGYLAVRSPLGYSLVGGARYYGIGNEFMGILLGAAVVALGGMLQRFHVSRRPATLMMAAGLAGLVVVLGASRMGANFGGALAAAVTAVTAVTALQEEPLRLGSRVILPAGAAAALTAAVVMTADLLGGGEPSHLGLALQRLAAGDWTTLWDIIRRKGAVNLRLMRWTIWNRVFLATLGAMVLVVARPAGMYRRLVRQYPCLGAAFAASVAGSVAALIFNDSGIVAAATTLLIPVSLLLSMVLLDPLGLDFRDEGAVVDAVEI